MDLRSKMLSGMLVLKCLQAMYRRKMQLEFSLTDLNLVDGLSVMYAINGVVTSSTTSVASGKWFLVFVSMRYLAGDIRI